jgi:hypothetical protein
MKFRIKNAEYTTAESYSDACEVFGNHRKFDYMFLDHDLGGTTFAAVGTENSGCSVAKKISELRVEYTEIIIHSMNFVGALAMQAVLPRALVVPFHVLTRLETPPWKVIRPMLPELHYGYVNGFEIGDDYE